MCLFSLKDRGFSAFFTWFEGLRKETETIGRKERQYCETRYSK